MTNATNTGGRRGADEAQTAPDGLRVAPRPGWCVLERPAEPDRVGPIHIPQTARDRTPGAWAPYEATVLAVGPPGLHTLKYRDPRTKKSARKELWCQADFAVGDRVIAIWWHHDLGDGQYLVRVTDVVAVLGEDAHIDPLVLHSLQVPTGDQHGKFARRPKPERHFHG